MSGIDECGLCITFVSQSTIEAQFAQHELSTIWNEVIYNRKKWFIAKLDDVNVENIYYGLGQYLYYQIENLEKIEEFIETIQRKINRLNE